jgi:hypothetical protein
MNALYLLIKLKWKTQQVPSDSNRLDFLFTTFCESAALNPDDEEDDQGDDEFYFNREEAFANMMAGYNQVCLFFIIYFSLN